jgi:hypothetical protein
MQRVQQIAERRIGLLGSVAKIPMMVKKDAGNF